MKKESFTQHAFAIYADQELSRSKNSYCTLCMAVVAAKLHLMLLPQLACFSLSTGIFTPLQELFKYALASFYDFSTSRSFCKLSGRPRT